MTIDIILVIITIIWLGLVHEGLAALEVTGTIAYVALGVIGLYYAVKAFIRSITGDKRSAVTLAAIFFLAAGIATMLVMRGII